MTWLRWALAGRVAHCPHCQRKTAQVKETNGWWVCQRCFNFVR